MLTILFFLLSSLYAFESSMTYSIQPYAVISDTSVLPEGSALLKSKRYDVIWSLNDSDNPPCIVPINLSGKILKPEWKKFTRGERYKGVCILDAHNIDWESMIYDSDGYIIIGDFGNNYSYRTDLSLYKIVEPNPVSIQTTIVAKYPFKYPDQKEYMPDKTGNYDGEAMFNYKNRIHIITKTRSTTFAGIYRFNTLTPWEMNIPELIGKFDFKSLVTDAAISDDEKYIAVLTYNYIWIFETNNMDNPFKGKSYYKEISLGQCEGITFISRDEILVSNEEGYLFKIKISDVLKNE